MEEYSDVYEPNDNTDFRNEGIDTPYDYNEFSYPLIKENAKPTIYATWGVLDYLEVLCRPDDQPLPEFNG